MNRYRFEISATSIVAKPFLGFSQVFSTKIARVVRRTLPSGSTILWGFFYLRAFSNNVFPFASYASPRTRKARDREKRRKSGLLACERRREEKASADRARLVLHFIAQYVTACSVGRCICPAVLGPNPRLSRLGRRVYYGRSSSAVAQLRFQLTSFSSGSPVVGERCSASQSTSRARDGIDAVHRTAKVMHRTRVRAHGRRGRCTLHTANLSRRIHSAARATGSFLGYYECVKTSYDGDAVPSRLSPSFTADSPPPPRPSRHPFTSLGGYISRSWGS